MSPSLKNHILPKLSTTLMLPLTALSGNDISSILAPLNLSEAQIIEITESWSEMLVRFLTNPMVAPLFMSLGMLGLFMEIKSPGFGVPGIIGLLCLGLFFGSHLLVGLADITEFLFLFAGI